jgi:hypothetical protein
MWVKMNNLYRKKYNYTSTPPATPELHAEEDILISNTTHTDDFINREGTTLNKSGFSRADFNESFQYQISRKSVVSLVDKHADGQTRRHEANRLLRKPPKTMYRALDLNPKISNSRKYILNF